MKLGILDLGSNSVKFFVYNILDGGKPKKIFNLKYQTQLAKNLFLKNAKISQNSIDSTIHAVKKFASFEEFKSLDTLVAVGTSALRNVKDNSLKENLEDIIGQEIKILSGDDEANLIAKGFLFKTKNKIKDGIVIDIGGGSTEIIVISNGEIEIAKSIKFGAIKIQEQVLKTYPPTPESINELKNSLFEELNNNFSNITKENAYGLSGSIKTLFKLYWCNDETIMSLLSNDVEILASKISKLNQNEIKEIKGMPEKRIDIIASGLLVLSIILQYFNTKNIHWNKATLKDGIISDFCKN